MSLTLDLENNQEISFNITSDIKKSENNYRSTEEFIITGNYGGVDFSDGIKLTSNLIYIFGKDVVIPDIENAKPFEEITEEEMLVILEKIENHPILKPIYELFAGYGNMDQDFDFDSDMNFDDDYEDLEF